MFRIKVIALVSKKDDIEHLVLRTPDFRFRRGTIPPILYRYEAWPAHDVRFIGGRADEDGTWARELELDKIWSRGKSAEAARAANDVLLAVWRELDARRFGHVVRPGGGGSVCGISFDEVSGLDVFERECHDLASCPDCTNIVRVIDGRRGDNVGP